MNVDKLLAALPPITGKWPYIDMVQVWVDDPLDADEQNKLQALCAGKVDFHDKRMRCQPEWPQRLQLRQPDDDAFRYLAKIRPKHLINKIEFALDLIAESWWEADQLQEFMETHWVQRWRGKRRCAKVMNTAYGSQKRWVRNQPVIYSDRPSKATGEVYCCHLEWRTSQASAVRSANVAGLADLISFDFRAFWENKLQLRAIDPGKLGRAYLRTRRRNPWIKLDRRGRPIDMDRVNGNQIIRSFQKLGPNGEERRPIGCAQEVIDRCWFDPARALVRIPTGEFLPA